MTLVDSNVLFDIVTDNAEWFDWSRQALERAEMQGPLGINDIIYAEFSVRYRTLAEVEEAVVALGLSILPISRAALFVAGKAFRQYRTGNDGAKTGVLPDFLIGAHAAVLGVPLLSRDTKRFHTYFPTLELITP